MRIDKIIINNFRGFKKEKTFEFGGMPFVMLTAPNGKGKTSIIDAIEWCLTGDIKRLHEVYNVRNKNLTEKKKNAGAILKNKGGSDEKTIVKVYASSGNKEYVICREQENDTLDDAGIIKVDNLEGEQAEKALNELIDIDNFYKYHFCDMQKTYRFLSNSRENIDNEFSDFSSDYTDVQTVVDNLGLICEDLDRCIDQKRNKKIGNDVLAEKEKTVKKYANAPEIFPYDKTQLYEGENTDIINMKKEQLSEQLKKLRAFGHERAAEWIEKKIVNDNAKKQKEELQKLKNEFILHEKDIRCAFEKGAYKEEALKEVESIFKKYVEMKLTVTNLNENCEFLFQIKNKDFNKDFWQEKEDKLNELKKNKKELDDDIRILSKGDKILDVVTTLTTKKDELIYYRTIMKQKNPEQVVLCPVCGSEKFDKIQNEEIAKQAQDYQAEHKNLIEIKKKKLEDIKTEENSIWEQRLNRANKVLEEAASDAKEELEMMTELYNASKGYFSILDNLQKKDTETFSADNMLSVDKIDTAIQSEERKILTQDEIKEIDGRINRIATILDEKIEDLSSEKILEDFKQKSSNAPKAIKKDEEILIKKICSVRSFLDNIEYLEAVEDLKESNEKNKKMQKDIDEYTTYKANVLTRINTINAQMDEMKKEEIAQVGPYLYKLYCKLSRDVQIDNIQTLKTKGDKTELLDENKKPLLNMFSDGQLSVFMISYFFGNIFRMQEKETFPVYFIDDITSCMDDINMLAFLDLIKYQLLSESRVMDQIFFATCNEKIQDLMEYKLGNCNIQYKKIGIEEFTKQ